MLDTEPRIAFGAFDPYGRPIMPGTRNAAIGYGIMNLPLNVHGTIADTADCPNLAHYLAAAQEAQRKAKLLERFAETTKANPLVVLAGCKITDHYFYSDEISLNIKTPEGTYAARAAHIIFGYGATQVSFGIHDKAAVSSHLYRNAPILIAKVEDDVITLEDGFQFALTPRFNSTQPSISANDTLKAELIHNLDMQAEGQDSVPALTLQ